MVILNHCIHQPSYSSTEVFFKHRTPQPWYSSITISINHCIPQPLYNSTIAFYDRGTIEYFLQIVFLADGAPLGWGANQPKCRWNSYCCTIMFYDIIIIIGDISVVHGDALSFFLCHGKVYSRQCSFSFRLRLNHCQERRFRKKTGVILPNKQHASRLPSMRMYYVLLFASPFDYVSGLSCNGWWQYFSRSVC